MRRACMPRRIVCRLLSVVVAALAVSAFAVPPLVGARIRAHAATATVKVIATEYKFALSAASAKPGKVTFKITNKGGTAHDFKIGGVTSALISPGSSTSIHVTFKKKGKYAYMCTVPGHAQLGMKGTFKIT
jgi:uncharacterized cupredoxin-like copper-binding protein